MKARLATCLLALASVAADTPASMRLVKSIQAEATGGGSIEDVLHVRKASGTFELNRKIEGVRLVVEMYRDGRKVKEESIGLSSPLDRATPSGTYSVQVVDLDYLKLGEPKPGHLRYVLSLTLNNMTAGTTVDIPKDIFGGVDASGLSGFNAALSGEHEAPLCLMTLAARPDGGGQRVINGSGPIAEVIAANRSNDILILKLVAEDRKKQGRPHSTSGSSTARPVSAER